MNIGIISERPLAVHILRQALTSTPAHRVIWIAKAADEAVKRCAKDTPDLVLMDLDKTGVNGVDVVRRIMACSPCPILMVTDSVNGNAARVFDAMGHGALDAVDMPALGSGNAHMATPLLAKIDTIARLVGTSRTVTGSGAASSALSSRPAGQGLLVGIGASAGGPAALATLLSGLPADFPGAIVIVQHVDEAFAAGMTEWLGQHSALPIRLAAEGDRPTPGTILQAGTSDHLVLKAANLLGYTPEPRHLVYRPSVDVFLQSMSQMWAGDALGVLLTGMGRDGALGLKALRDRGHHTIAQDEASSAVYGMPKAAVAIGAAVEVLPLCRIATRLIAYCNEN
ncbi:MAG TPA: chemotaxis response regulator protein-glutamate methylesterase [Vicinamibacterales bacterium]|nr:chemotaxis response regulator protein-glutamate methylesterase [Vicinamibacterales bacterium]